MNVTESVIRDLWVLVEAGEAGEDSRALVEAWLARSPALAAELSRAPALPPTAVVPAPPPDIERRALLRTRRLLRRKTWSLAFGLFFTGLPLSFVWDSHGVRFPLLQSHPVAVALSLVAAVAIWIIHARTARALRPAGF